MFNDDLYPTPAELISTVLEGEVVAGKVCYDPSAGKGDLVDALHARGAAQVWATELEPDLRRVLWGKDCYQLGEDFLKVTAEQVSSVQLVVMNPPFNQGARHVLHAFAIAPAGCRVLALLNRTNLDNPYTRERRELAELVALHGDREDLGAAFRTAERRTDVEVALLRLRKPGADYATEFEGFFLEEEVEEQAYAVVGYNLIRDVVNRYVEAVKTFDAQLETAVRLNELRDGYLDRRGFGDDGRDGPVAICVSRGGVALKRAEFKKQMQKSGWRFIFDRLDMAKYATRGLKADINKFVETQEAVPFTMRNVYRLLEIVVGTHEGRMDQALLEAFDKVTRHHAENQYGVEGWKTNSHYLMTRRFIMPGVCWQDQRWHRGPEIELGSSAHGDGILDDLNRVLCHLAGRNYDDLPTLYARVRNADGKYPAAEYGRWFEWAFFRCKAFKKGTMHLEFLDEDLWARFNQRVAKLKGYPLPEAKPMTAYQRRQHGRKEAATA